MTEARSIPSETPADIYAALVRGEIVLVDVREPAEYAAERIAEALAYPLSAFDPAELPAGKGKLVVLQCGSGKRSEIAYRRAFSAGVLVRGHMSGGLIAWKAAGLPVVSGAPATSRQADRA